MADIAIDGVEHIWHVGDSLPDGTTLTAIGGNGITTSRGGNSTLLPFDLRPISHDDHFDVLPLQAQADTPAGSSNEVPTPLAHQADVVSVSDRLAALRAAGVAEWVKRSGHPPPQSPSPPH